MSFELKNSDLENLIKLRFQDIDDSVISELVRIGEIIEIKSQEKVIVQGNTDKDVFLLITGRLLVSFEDTYGKTKIVNEICHGEFLGEMAVFTDQQRSTSVIAARHSILLKFAGETFQDLLDKNASLVKSLGGMLIKRLAESNTEDKKWSIPKHIVIQPISASFDTKPFSRKLLEHLSRFGKVLLIDSKLLSSLPIWEDEQSFETLGKQFSHWLYGEEHKYDFVLFESCFDLNSRSKIFIDQSDRILLVDDGTSNNETGPIENQIIQAKKLHELLEVSLVLDQTDRENHAKVNFDYNLRSFKNIYHLKENVDFKRLARVISGNAIKLVLGGGGAKGFAHIGVYKAMLELGIPVDLIGGTSIGAIIAAAIAIKWPYKVIEEKIYNSLVQAKPLKTYQLPLISLLSPAKLEAELENEFGDTLIEDLEIPFYAVAADLSLMTTQIMDRGLVKNAVRASISLPAIMPPYVHENSLLLDGGIVDNLPYDHMQTLATGPTIGVDLSFIKERKLGYSRIPKNASLLFSKVTGKKKYKVPGIHQIVMGTMTLASNEKRMKNMAKFEVYIQPDVAKFGFLKWDKFHPIIQAGYEASYEKLKAWKEENSHLL